MGVYPIDPDGHGFRMERSSESIATKVFVNIAFIERIASMNPTPLTDVKSIRDIVVVREFIVRKSNIGLASFGLNIVEPTKVVVAKDFFDRHTFFPVGQHPARSITSQIPPPINSQHVELSIGNDRLGV